MAKTITKIETWNFEKAALECKAINATYQRNKKELAIRLIEAHEILSNSGFRSDLIKDSTSCQSIRGSKEKIHTFEEFIETAGIAKRTAYRWMNLYDPVEDRMLSLEEFKERLVAHYEELIKELQQTRNKDSDWRPDGWTNQCETYYRKKLLKEEEERALLNSSTDFAKESERFSHDYFSLLLGATGEPTAQDILHFDEVLTKYEPLLSKKVKARDQAMAFTFIEKAIDSFQEDVRPEVATALANMTALKAEELRKKK